MTSARMTKREDSTTELVAERPTPSVPPSLFIPWKHAIVPMIRPNTAVRNVGARKVAEAGSCESRVKEFLKGNRIGQGIQNPTGHYTAEIGGQVSSGSIRMQAVMRVKASSL